MKRLVDNWRFVLVLVAALLAQSPLQVRFEQLGWSNLAATTVAALVILVGALAALWLLEKVRPAEPNGK